MTPHFFGAVVVDQPERVVGGIVTHEVIDGQQRLTTAQLLIAAAARTCETARTGGLRSQARSGAGQRRSWS
jgi:hypothetical protein